MKLEKLMRQVKKMSDLKIFTEMVLCFVRVKGMEIGIVLHHMEQEEF